MAKTFFYVTLFCVMGWVSAASADTSYYPSYFYPMEHRSNLRSLQEESKDASNYEFQIVPSDQYDVAQYDTSLQLGDLIPGPIIAVANIGKIILSKALLVIKKVISNGLWIALGAGLVTGFCAFTPYCTLTIEQPFSRELQSFSQDIPYLDEVERFFYQAYDKIHDM